MKMEELKELPVEELKLRLRDTALELSNLMFQHATHQLDNPLKIRTTKREVAQLRTILREYELGIRKPRTKQL